MGNPTKVYFFREDVLMSKSVSLKNNTGYFELNLDIFINACITQAHFYAKQGNYNMVGKILSVAEEQILPDYSKRANIHSLPLRQTGVKEITTFERSSVFDDVEKIIPSVPVPLRFLLEYRLKNTDPRFPTHRETSFRLLIRYVARPGMFFFDKDEIQQIVNALETFPDRLLYDEEWKQIITAHKSEEYDLALFYSFV